VNYKVVYFTRTGVSKRVAEKIANKLSCELVQITDNMNWKGIFGFIRAGRYAMKEKAVKIEIHGSFGSSEGLIVVTPLWAGWHTRKIYTFGRLRRC